MTKKPTLMMGVGFFGLLLNAAGGDCVSASGDVQFDGQIYTFSPETAAVLGDGTVVNAENLTGFAEKVANRW